MSIEKRGENKWRFRIRKDGQNYTMNFFGNEKSAIKAHKEFEVDILRGNVGLNENMLFAELCQKVLDDYVRASGLKLNTERIYITAYNLHLLPVFGACKIGSIKTYSIQKFINDLTKKFKKNTVTSISSVLSVTFKKAVEWGFIKKSPYQNIKMPKQANSITELLTLAQLETLFGYYDSEPNLMHKSAFYLAAYLGLRNSEIRALSLNDIDFDAMTISVNKQYGQIRDVNGNIINTDIDPKTNGSNRVIYAPKLVMDALACYIDSCSYELTDKIFINPCTMQPVTTHCFSKRFTSVVKQLGLPTIRFHDLRHIHATLLINSGVDVLNVSKRLGHSKVDTTLNVYSHTIRDVDKQIALSLGNTIASLKSPKS